MESAAITTRGVKGIEGKGAFRGVILVIRCRGGGNIRLSITRSQPPRGAALRCAGHRFSSFSRLGCSFMYIGSLQATWGRAGGLKPALPDPQEPLEMSQPAIGLPSASVLPNGEADGRRVSLCKTPLSHHWTGAEHTPKPV